MKGKSDTKIIIATSLGVQGRWEEKMSSIFINRVTSPEALRSVTRVPFREPSSRGDYCSSSEAFFVETGGEVGSSTIKLVAMSKR